MRSTLLGWLLLVLVSAFWPGQTSAMADAKARVPLTQACAAQRLDTQATAGIVLSSDAEDWGTSDAAITDLAGDEMDCLQAMVDSCRSTRLPQKTPHSTSRTPASHWPEAPQRPPCPQAA